MNSNPTTHVIQLYSMLEDEAEMRQLVDQTCTNIRVAEAARGAEEGSE